MRLIYIDVDTLRADHVGCYGYLRPTTPCIDLVAEGGCRFDQVYVSDSPCLPSRTALVTGRFGVTNGVVNHGGGRAELFSSGRARSRRSSAATTSWPALLRDAGMWCATISTFAERHSAYHWHAGFNESYNLGLDGHETADRVAPVAIDWLRRNGQRDAWFLHVHLWDPHAPYRTPAEYGNPFSGMAAPAWLNEEVIQGHWDLAGPHSAQEVLGFGPDERYTHLERQPQQVASVADALRMFDGYDVGIHYADAHVGRILSVLDDLGIYEDTAVMISSDHGENLGELGIYCDHQTADLHTHRVPMILRWPGLDPGTVDTGFHYQIDVAATVAELCGVKPPPDWDGVSFAPDLATGRQSGRDHLVLSCGAWAMQRSVRFDRWLYTRTYHDAFHGFPDTMLFDVEADPHELHDVAADHRDVAGRAADLLLGWEVESMRRSPAGVDPFWSVMAEGGGFYVRDRLEPYLERLECTGRLRAADQLRKRYLGSP